MSGVSVSSPMALRSFSSSFQSRNQTINPSYALCSSANPIITSLSSVTIKKQSTLRFGTPITGESRGISFRCNSNTGPVDSGSSDYEIKDVMDAFFMGKALAEAVNERIESTVGEFLSAIGKLQTEHQTPILEFQKDVLERAKKVKENAAKEALGAQGLVPMATEVDAPIAKYDTGSATSSSTNYVVASANSSSSPDA